MIFGEGPSAFVGQPPNTERDYYIVKGFLRAAGLENVDPALGYIRAAQPPNSGYVYTSKSPGIIAGLIIIIVAITVATVSRLALRVSMTQLRFGADDWACIAAAVSLPCEALSAHLPCGSLFSFLGTFDEANFVGCCRCIRVLG